MDKVLKRVLLLTGLSDENFIYGTNVRPEALVTQTAVKDAILQADMELCHDIISSPTNSFRNLFITDTPTPLSHGDELPAFSGQHGRVYSIVDNEKVPGRLARNLDHVVKTRRAPGVYGVPADALYWIENGYIFFAGDSDRIYVEVPNLTKSETDVLQSPLAYENALIAYSIPHCFVEEQAGESKSFYAQQAASYKAMIRGDALTVPNVERYQRTGV